MTKKEWNKFKLQLALGKRPKEVFILAIRDAHFKMFCGSCKSEHLITKECNKCHAKWIETIDQRGIILNHVYMTGYYPKKFDD